MRAKFGREFFAPICRPEMPPILTARLPPVILRRVAWALDCRSYHCLLASCRAIRLSLQMDPRRDLRRPRWLVSENMRDRLREAGVDVGTAGLPRHLRVFRNFHEFALCVPERYASACAIEYHPGDTGAYDGDYYTLRLTPGPCPSSAVCVGARRRRCGRHRCRRRGRAWCGISTRCVASACSHRRVVWCQPINASAL